MNLKITLGAQKKEARLENTLGKMLLCCLTTSYALGSDRPTTQSTIFFIVNEVEFKKSLVFFSS